MNKIVVLMLALALLLVACGTNPDATNAPETTTTQAPTHEPGLNTTPSDFVGFDDPSDPTESTTEPTESTTESTEPTEPKPTEPKPTEPKPTEPKPTEPVEGTVPSNVSIAPDAEGFILYTNLDPSEQYAFFKEFNNDAAAFDAWLDTAEAAFRAKYPEYIYNGGPIVLPE